MIRTVSFISLGIITLGLITATLAEKFLGSDVATDDFYHAPWMIALWIISATSCICSDIACRKAMSVAVMMLHFSLILILVGAGVTHYFGKQGNMTLSLATPTDSYTLDDGSAKSLPFTVTLMDYGTEYRTGTLTPADYYSEISVCRAGVTAIHRISMNNTLSIDCYRFCQASMSGDSSTLGISHDPWGTGISFGAYGLLFLSMLSALCTRSGRFRTSLRRLLAVAIMLPALHAGAGNTTPVSPFTPAPEHASGTAPLPTVLQRPLADTFGQLCIYSGDRVKPLSTFAREFCLNVYGKESYRGLTPEQVLTGWIFYYDSWKREPMIQLRSKEARSAMDGERYVSLSQLYSGGEYRLEKLLSAPGPVSRDLYADDSRIALITTVCTGSAIKIFPAPGSDGTSATWHSWAESNPDGIGVAMQSRISSAISEIYSLIGHGRFRDTRRAVLSLCELQRSMSPQSIPSTTALRSEHLYNHIFYPLVSAIIVLMTGMTSLALYMYGKLNPRGIMTWIAVATFAYTSLLIILRWIIGGHIPLATGYETMLTLAWVSMALALLSIKRIPVIMPLGMIVAGASLLVAMMGTRNPAVGSLMPVLGSRLLSLHVMLVMTSYSLFAILALLSLVSLSSMKQVGRMSLVADVLLTPALFLLGAGIFVGAIWAEQSWGRYWGWDPKETWALITFFIYALPLHRHTFPWFRTPRHRLIYLSVAFASVLMTYFGVNYLLPGLHSYGS
ncbi:MAG: cytochrome c biogenesis protein CcsA [Paenibacillus sp.]|nr:cytochrome c biogenesis protein CcsA [Paenibacillus sp.]